MLLKQSAIPQQIACHKYNITVRLKGANEHNIACLCNLTKHILNANLFHLKALRMNGFNCN